MRPYDKKAVNIPAYRCEGASLDTDCDAFKKIRETRHVASLMFRPEVSHLMDAAETCFAKFPEVYNISQFR